MQLGLSDQTGIVFEEAVNERLRWRLLRPAYACCRDVPAELIQPLKGRCHALYDVVFVVLLQVLVQRLPVGARIQFAERG